MVLIAGQPRSGSTLLLRIFNSLPEVRLCGENGGGIQGLLSFLNQGLYHSQLAFCEGKTYEQLLQENRFPAWYCQFNKTEIEDQVKHLIERYLNPNHCEEWGFKEILFGSESYAQMKTEFFLLHQMFPDLKILFTTRKQDHIERSCQQKFGEVPEYIASQRDNFLRYAGEFPERSKVIYFHTLTDFNPMEEVVDWATGMALNLKDFHRVTEVKLGGYLGELKSRKK